MVADRAGSIFLKWNLEVIMEMEEKLTGIQRSASVPYGGMCMYGGVAHLQSHGNSWRWGARTPSHTAKKAVKGMNRGGGQIIAFQHAHYLNRATDIYKRLAEPSEERDLKGSWQVLDDK